MIAANSNSMAASEEPKGHGDYEEYVTALVDEQMFGFAIDRVHDVFIASTLTEVPLAPREIIGLINLRGRVVTAMCMRRRLGLPDCKEPGRNMAVGLEHKGESYGLFVDEVGEVMKLGTDTLEPNPVHMDKRWVKLSRGVHRLDDQLLIILDVDAVLSLEPQSLAA
jgi:purine-binding chemotaxis protein CheW